MRGIAPNAGHRKHRWNLRGRWGDYLSGDVRRCRACSLFARRAPEGRWLINASGAEPWGAERRYLPACFGSTRGLERAIAAPDLAPWHRRPNPQTAREALTGTGG